jgi:hypothetical protein
MTEVVVVTEEEVVVPAMGGLVWTRPIFLRIFK